ncbi:hypothetical protein QYE76_037766 [Lolium multiflorum]|uniref:Aminotransferase-like plant mobile domain-containing protein n=1 Tax=Lolium multiflorum TaxID=4521 RepID=A0AAD8Q2G1_LOLMU|nr:hypothetical protein QYE76_037766 [Lolium multiflorum]
MNPSALTALVDRWRPETHTFHLRAGEMAPTLQDVSMILGLPIQGEPLCMNTTSDGWRQQMAALIGMAPPAPANPKERAPAGAPFAWIRTNFGQPPPEDANEDTIRTYTRVYLWVLNERPWPHYRNNLDREPTWAYLWDNVSEMTSDPKIMYMQYTAELDTLTAEQVEWEPYGTYYHIGAGMADLNHKCTEEARFWRMRCPLICMWLVEHHQPHRVMRQFGLYQECPPQWQDTDKELHRLDRQRQRKITNWPVHHSGHVAAFLHCLEATRNAGPVEIVPHDLAAFNNYLEWFHENTRIELVKHAYAEDILDDPIEFDEVAQSQHDTFARRGRSTSIASELNFVRTEIQKTAHECEIMWDQSGRDEKPVGPLRHFIKNTARKMRRLANLLGCREGEIPTSSSSEEREIPDEEEILSQSIPPKHTDTSQTSNIDPNNVPLASLVAQEENVDVNFIKNNNFNNNAYRNNYGNNNYRPYPSNNGNGYGNSYNNNKSVPSGLEVMLKEFISTQTAFNKTVEEKLGKIDILASKVDSLALYVDLLKLKVMPEEVKDSRFAKTNAIQVRINDNIRMLAELHARWDKEEKEKLAKENNIAKVWTITTTSNVDSSHVAAPPTINGKIIGVGNVSTPSAKRTKLPETAKTAACDKSAEIFQNIGDNDSIDVDVGDMPKRQ